MPIGLLLILSILSTNLWAKMEYNCNFKLKTEEDLEAALTCETDPEDFRTAMSGVQGMKKIVSEMKLYPAYSKQGEFLKFVSVEGKFQKGLVLVAKGEGAVENHHKDLSAFESFESNHYQADLSCFAAHQKAAIPSEQSIHRCIDEQIRGAMKVHRLDEIRRFSLAKLQMIYKESTAGFDTQGACGGLAELTFFQGKVYNQKDFGNFVWGAIMQKLKVSDFTKKVGSTLNGYLHSGKQNEGFFKSTHILGDHPRDQVAIFDGARWVRRSEKAAK